MKTKAKLTLAISVLSAVVLSAGVTSTFAWFTTKAKVTFSSNTVTVKAPATLSIQGRDVSNGVASESVIGTATSTSITGVANKSLGSVSSLTGQSFFTYQSLEEEYSSLDDGNSIVAWANAANNNYKDYIKYNVAVTAAKGENGKHLKVQVPAPTITGTNCVEWYRIGVYLAAVDNSAAPKTDLSLAPLGTGFQMVFGNTAADDDTAYSDASTMVSDRVVTKAGYDGDDTDNEPDYYNVDTSAFATSSSAAVTAHFVIAIWIEGTKADSQNGAGGETIAATVNFELY